MSDQNTSARDYNLARRAAIETGAGAAARSDREAYAAWLAGLAPQIAAAPSERMEAFRRARAYHRRAHGPGTTMAIPGGRPLLTCQSDLCRDRLARLTRQARS